MISDIFGDSSAVFFSFKFDFKWRLNIDHWEERCQPDPRPPHATIDWLLTQKKKKKKHHLIDNKSMKIIMGAKKKQVDAVVIII